MEDQAYLAAFRTMDGLGAVRLRRLREHFGSLAQAWRASSAELGAVAGIGPELAQAIAAQRPERDPERELARLTTAGLQLIAWWDPAYPRLLGEINDAPAALYVRGQLARVERAVAVVGTRRCSPYGARLARELSRDLAAAGVWVISGLAVGIDTAAHQGALEAGRTAAVLGSGLDRIYPAANRELAARIALQGAVLSEYPLGTEPAPGQFPARNRIVAGLCQAILVVEAGERSGALITSELGLEHNREVMAVPGPADSPRSKGPHRLIQQGARLVLEAADVLDELGWSSPPAPRAALELMPLEAAVFEAIDSEPLLPEGISSRCGLPPATVNSVLLTLELKALIVQLPGRRYVRR